ncbi:MAG TPA: hypothetical protein VJT49_30335 [Amycolatopsis sp.]|uniref:hypothetical protein n=1 Tax=Amycolatopsis sp. TaxID=37632 RepID=UPI002B49184F|nr:hypothetical protein [Amycolatopsis sp.]HKS49332.1 hypothetical protein [Amycolatopsis sp.]
MADREPARNHRFDEDLIGLDPSDPEAQAFAAHLDRMERCEPTFTIEASLHGVAEFADSSNRASGLKWWLAVAVAALIVLGVLVSSWDIIVRAVAWLSQ